jgi:hypothetical protein
MPQPFRAIQRKFELNRCKFENTRLMDGDSEALKIIF